MGEKGQLIRRFQQVALGQALGDVARGFGDRALRFAGGAELFPDVVGRNGGIGPLVPGDVERAQALLGRPHVIADDGDQIVEHDDLTHAGEALGFGVIDVPHRAAEHRTGGNGRELHAGRHGIDSVHDFAVDLVGGVEPLERVADQFEIFDVLERRIVRRREAAGAVDQRRIGEPAAARLMDGLAVLGVNAGGIHFPLLRSGLNQNGARAGGCLAQGQPERAHRIRIAGDLDAERRIAVELVIRRRGFERHSLEGRIEFLGQDHGDGRIDALAHLDLRHDQRDRAVAVDANEGVGREGRLLRRVRPAPRAGERRPPSCRPRRLRPARTRAASVRCRPRSRPARRYAWAACLIASRMRT